MLLASPGYHTRCHNHTMLVIELLCLSIAKYFVIIFGGYEFDIKLLPMDSPMDSYEDYESSSFTLGLLALLAIEFEMLFPSSSGMVLHFLFSYCF